MKITTEMNSDDEEEEIRTVSPRSTAMLDRNNSCYLWKLCNTKQRVSQDREAREDHGGQEEEEEEPSDSDDKQDNEMSKNKKYKPNRN